MTVNRRNEQSIQYPTSDCGSDTDTLYSSSSNNEPPFVGEGRIPFRPSARMARINSLTNDCLCKNKYIGRKKRQRLANNGLILQTVIEDEETNNSFVKLTDDFKTPLERLMENEGALRFWNKFIELPEKDQNMIINPNKEFVTPSINQQTNPIKRISSKVKRALKIKRNIPFNMLQDIEKNLLNHFGKPIGDMYITCPKNSFERLMLHAVAQYHYLQSISVYGTWPPRIQVFTNDNSTWQPADVFFCDVVEQLWKSG